MDIHKCVHHILEIVKSGHLHLPLFAGLIGAMGRPEQSPQDEISDLGDLGDNVPATLLKSLSSRRETL